MGCCLSDEEKRERQLTYRIQQEQRQVSKKIEKMLKTEREQSYHKFKLLLLGSGESGKSTIIKQMQIIHGKGYSDEDKRNFIEVIEQNIYVAMQTLIRKMETMQIKYEMPENLDHANLIKNAKDYHINESFGRVLKTLWEDEGIQECYKRRREYQLMDSTEYFLENIDRVTDANYLPTDQDILRSRVATTAITEVSIYFGKREFKFVDVGGQRTERKKWLNLFDDANAIIFISALSEYDQTLCEAENVNRLKESLALFKTIINYPFFKNRPFVLFLNKIDILEGKIINSDLADYFPEFHGPPRDALAAREFILRMFLDPKENTNNNGIFSHFTCATDTKNIEHVFKVVKSSILEKNLEMRLIK